MEYFICFVTQEVWIVKFSVSQYIVKMNVCESVVLHVCMKENFDMYKRERMNKQMNFIFMKGSNVFIK